MTTTCLRLLAVVGVFLFSCKTAVGQQPEAPAPHPTLDELVRQYHRYGLPVPPWEAELVRIPPWVSAPGPYDVFYEGLGFRYPPTEPGGSPRFLVGLEWSTTAPWDTDRARAVKPTPQAIEGIRGPWGSYGICLAVQCKIRGWHDLAEALYAAARQPIGYDADGSPIPPPPILDMLHQAAWYYWENRLLERSGDRSRALPWLKRLSQDGPVPAGSLHGAAWNFATIRDLELTIAPRTSRPGTVAALVDDLTEYWQHPNNVTSEEGREPYWRLVDRGFDTLPVLIDYVGDTRLTRVKAGYFNNFGGYIYRVGHIVAWFLDDLADGEFSRQGAWFLTGGFLDPVKVRKWWARANKIGERAWVLGHVLPQRDGCREQCASPNKVLLRILRVKYPELLPAQYAKLLTTRPWTDSELFVHELLASRLPRNVKVAVLERAAGHWQLAHRDVALDGLAKLDPVAFRRQLLATLNWMPPEVDWTPHCFRLPHTNILHSVLDANDPKCWDALTRAASRSAVPRRIEILDTVGYAAAARGRDDPAWRESIRFLLGFLDDPAVHQRVVGEPRFRWSLWLRDYTTLEVRNVAAIELAAMVGRPLPIDSRSPFEWFAIREAVRQVAMRELAHAAK